MAYTQWTLATLRQALADRLNDHNQIFWTSVELTLHLQDAIRFWNCLTADAKKNYALAVDPSSVWYDLQTLSGSPIICELSDRDIYTRLTYSLLEPPSNLAAVSTLQFNQTEIVQAVQRKRDEFLFRTGCTSSVESLNVNPNVATISLPQTVIQARRAYWIPASGSGAFPVFKTDEYATAAYQPNAVITPGTPNTFSAGIEPPLTLEITPPPASTGVLEVLTIESRGVLSPSSATTLLIPSDFTPGLTWGSLSDLLGINSQASDPQRAAYSRQRFEEYIALMDAYPFVLGARVSGLPVFCDAVETLDLYSPAWRTVSANPSIIGLSGKNLVAFPTATAMQITLLMCGNATVPAADTDNIQLGDEILDGVLDEAQSVASFKMGGAEAAEAGKLHENIIRLAAKRNNKIRAMSIFSSALYGRAQRENQFAPLEMSAE